MRILLDECVDRRLAREIEGHEVRTVPEAGWASLKNGQLLTKAQGDYDVFVTVDRHLEHQQDLARYSIAVVVLVARSNRAAELRLLIPKLLAVLPVARAGAATVVAADPA